MDGESGALRGHKNAKLLLNKYKEGALDGGLQVDQVLVPLSESVTAEPAVSAVSTPPAVSPVKGVQCSLCPAVMKAVSRTGRPRSKKQQLHQLKLHTKKHAG